MKTIPGDWFVEGLSLTVEGQAIVQLPVESQRMHEDEAERLRIELEASRRHEEQLANQLRAQVRLPRSRPCDT